jgi:hypothetical protein
MKKKDFELFLSEQRSPNVPVHAKVLTRKRKKTETGELTFLILRYSEFKNATSYRINSQGQYDPRTKKWRPSMQKKGLSDIQIIYRGRFIACEVKALKTDKLSIHQLERKSEIVNAGGLFIQARSFEQFQLEFDSILDKIDKEYSKIHPNQTDNNKTITL